MSRRGWRPSLVAAAWLALAWLTLLVIGYYVIHKPFGPALALGLASATLDLGLAAALAILAGGLGRRLVGEVHPDVLASLALQAAVGLGLLSVAVLGVGLVGGFHGWVAWLALLALALAVGREASAWAHAWKVVGVALRAGRGLAVGVAVLAAALLAFSLAEALAPPVHFDALVYHLSLPSAFLASGRLTFIPSNPFWGMPLGGEMLYTWAMALDRAQTAAVLGWTFGVVALAGTLGLGRAFGGRAAWAGVAAVLAGETASAALGWAYVDWLAALHGLGLIVALDAWRRRPDSRTLAIAGALAGFAVGVKYTAGAGLAAGAVVLLVLAGWRRAGAALLPYLGAAALVSAPWLLKNLLLAGAPLYPLAGGGAWYDPLRQVLYRDAARSAPLARAWLTPLLASLQGTEGVPGFAASLGPLLLGLVPGAVLVRKARAGQASMTAVFLVAGWIIWAAASMTSAKLNQSRLYAVLLPAWAALAGAGFAGLSRVRLAGVRFGRLAAGLVLLPLALTALQAGRQAVDARLLAPIVGAESPTDYLTLRLGGFAPAMQAARAAGGPGTVLALWEARSYYCMPACLPDPWLDNWILVRRTQGSPAAILATWRQAGISHLLLHRAGMDFVRFEDPRYEPQDWADLDRLLSNLPVVFQTAGYELYRISP